MHPSARGLQALFEAHADPVQAEPMAAYMRNQFEYLGIKTPQGAALQKQYYAEHGWPSLGELDPLIRDLWALPQREFQYVAIGLLDNFKQELPPEFIETLDYLIVTKAWWDTVDSIAGTVVGAHFKHHPQIKVVWLDQWRQSDNFWQRRTALLFQLNYKKETDFPLLCAIIRENLGSKEFFINKAIGWALRQYSRVDAASAQAVREFVAETPLQPLSAREALKWLEKPGR